MIVSYQRHPVYFPKCIITSDKQAGNIYIIISQTLVKPETEHAGELVHKPGRFVVKRSFSCQYKM